MKSNTVQEWTKFPNPIELGTTLNKFFMEILYHPKKPVLYQIRNSLTNENVLFGIGVRAAERMGSLLPKENGGRGTRNNAAKREYVRDNLDHLEFRAIYFEFREEAKAVEDVLRLQKNHIFNT